MVETKARTMAPASARRHRLQKRLGSGMLFCSPFIIGFIALNMIPMVLSLYYSFCRYEITSSPRWIGLQQYQRIFKDPAFYLAIRNTLLYAGLSVPLGIILGLMIALLLNQKISRLGIWRSIYYLPAVAPTVAYALLWRWMLSPQFGIINTALGLIGLPVVDWLGDPNWIIIGFVMASVWACGSGMIIYLAGLQSIPSELYEAAMIDGANAIRRFSAVTLPMISPVLFYNLIMGIVGAMQSFTFMWIIVGGDSLHHVYSELGLTYMLLLYRVAFQFFRMGYASAMAWLLFIIIVALTLIVIQTSRRWVYYEGEWLTGS